MIQGSTFCKACDAGKANANPGSHQESDCLPCEQGRFSFAGVILISGLATKATKGRIWRLAWIRGGADPIMRHFALRLTPFICNQQWATGKHVRRHSRETEFPDACFFSGQKECSQCPYGTFVGVTGSTTCSSCRVGCEFDEFESTHCTDKTDRVCTPYQYKLDVHWRILLACSPAATIILAVIFDYITMWGIKIPIPLCCCCCFCCSCSGIWWYEIPGSAPKNPTATVVEASETSESAEETMKSDTTQPSDFFTVRWFIRVWQIFFGLYDVVSDWQLLVLIDPRNPWHLFPVALSSLVAATLFSWILGALFAQKYRQMEQVDHMPKLSWWYVGWLCWTTSANNLDDGYAPDYFKDAVKRLVRNNAIGCTMLETIPLLSVQAVLFRTTGTGKDVVDEILLAEAIAFTFINMVKNLVSAFRTWLISQQKKEEEAREEEDDDAQQGNFGHGCTAALQFIVKARDMV
mmetsp:Transcript_74239/g.198213  ORF Transcript_74239/g.198213 Transcript_74239/m.198213 type:complete len:464 (-) Transcript_74239:174-1565(-)